MKHPAKLIRADGTEQELAPVNGRYFTFAELYPLIETDTIQIIPLPNGKLMLMDENGKGYFGANGGKSKPRNDLATVIADNIAGDDYIVGNVVVCDRSQLD
jgi:hypothetical protein